MHRDEPLRILLVSNNPVLCGAIRDVLVPSSEFHLVAEADAAIPAGHLITEWHPEFLLVSPKLRRHSGFDLIRWVQRFRLNIAIVLVSDLDYDQYIRAARRLGVSGYLRATDVPRELISTLQAVRQGKLVYPPMSKPQSHG